MEKRCKNCSNNLLAELEGSERERERHLYMGWNSQELTQLIAVVVVLHVTLYENLL